jgi:hypothetical protein
MIEMVPSQAFSEQILKHSFLVSDCKKEGDGKQNTDPSSLFNSLLPSQMLQSHNSSSCKFSAKDISKTSTMGRGRILLRNTADQEA